MRELEAREREGVGVEDLTVCVCVLGVGATGTGVTGYTYISDFILGSGYIPPHIVPWTVCYGPNHSSLSQSDGCMVCSVVCLDWTM